MWEKLIEALEVLVIGMGGVFTSLIFFYLLIVLLKKIDGMIQAKESKTLEIATNQRKEAEDLSRINEIDNELIAVISAAAYSIVRKPVRVKTISFLGNKDDSTWSQIGKIDVISSHNVQGH